MDPMATMPTATSDDSFDRPTFIPISIAEVPAGAFVGVAVYVRARRDKGEGPPEIGPWEADFSLYCAASVRFTAESRQRLLDNGTRFVYIRAGDKARFCAQMEAHPPADGAEGEHRPGGRTGLVYDTGIEVLDELLHAPVGIADSVQVSRMAGSIVTLVKDQPSAMASLLAIAHHDLNTATHQMNVGAWMAPLAAAMGFCERAELLAACQAGLLHDIGKLSLPADLLAKPGPLTPDDRAQLRLHPELGHKLLATANDVDPVVKRVVLEHHERPDGRGYPRGLRGDQIHPLSRMCAVVESFDAMTAATAFRPARMRVPEALEALRREPPGRYDPAVVTAWCELVLSAWRSSAGPAKGAGSRRQHERHTFNCTAIVQPLDAGAVAPLRLSARNVSRGGVGLLSAEPMPIGCRLRIQMNAKGWEHRTLEGVVVRCRQCDDGSHEIGVRFTEVRGGEPGASGG